MGILSYFCLVLRFVLFCVDCNSCYNHHMAGMGNTAPRPCLFTHSQSHSHILSLSPVPVLGCYDVICGAQDGKMMCSHAHSLILCSLYPNLCFLQAITINLRRLRK